MWRHLVRQQSQNTRGRTDSFDDLNLIPETRRPTFRVDRKVKDPERDIPPTRVLNMFCFVAGETLPYSGSEDEEDEENSGSTTGLMKHHHLHSHGQLHPGTPETNNNSLSAGDLQGPLSHSTTTDTKPGQDDSEDQGES